MLWSWKYYNALRDAVLVRSPSNLRSLFSSSPSAANSNISTRTQPTFQNLQTSRFHITNTFNIHQPFTLKSYSNIIMHYIAILASLATLGALATADAGLTQAQAFCPSCVGNKSSKSSRFQPSHLDSTQRKAQRMTKQIICD